MKVTTTVPEPITVIELTDHERFQLSRILSWFRTNAQEGTPDYSLSLDISYEIDSHLKKRGRPKGET